VFEPDEILVADDRRGARVGQSALDLQEQRMPIADVRANVMPSVVVRHLLKQAGRPGRARLPALRRPWSPSRRRRVGACQICPVPTLSDAPSDRSCHGADLWGRSARSTQAAVGMPQTGPGCPRASGLMRTSQRHSEVAYSTNAALRSTVQSDANDRSALRPGMSHTLKLRQRIVNPTHSQAALRLQGLNVSRTSGREPASHSRPRGRVRGTCGLVSKIA
jgi:hypothetical protein